MDNNSRIQKLLETYNQRVGEANLLKSQKDAITKSLLLLEEDLGINMQSRDVLEVLSKLTEKDIKEYIEPLVTEAIRTVFNYDITFSLEFGFDRNQVSVRFNLTDGNGNTVGGNIEDIKGGGILDVISIVLRFVLLELFEINGPVILDEPGKFVDTSHQPALGALIYQFSKRFNRQIIIVTHDDAICSIGTKHYVVSQDYDGKSSITLLED